MDHFRVPKFWRIDACLYYENHRTVEWAQIFILSPHPLFVAAPPIFVEELSWYVSLMAHMTKTGRVYERGRALNNHLRRSIIQDIVENGGDFVTGFFPGNLSVIALKNRTKYDTVKKIWKQFCESGTT